jgi:hypothetical protein
VVIKFPIGDVLASDGICPFVIGHFVLIRFCMVIIVVVVELVVLCLDVLRRRVEWP